MQMHKHKERVKVGVIFIHKYGCLYNCNEMFHLSGDLVMPNNIMIYQCFPDAINHVKFIYFLPENRLNNRMSWYW